MWILIISVQYIAVILINGQLLHVYIMSIIGVLSDHTRSFIYSAFIYYEELVPFRPLTCWHSIKARMSIG